MSDGKKLKPQRAPKPPHQDPKFLASTPARPIRILGEYIHPLVQLKREGIGDTIVMFGSARIESHETAQARCARLKNVKTSKLSAAKLSKHRADAAAFAQADHLVAHARAQAAALCGLFGRRPGNHGSGEPRRV